MIDLTPQLDDEVLALDGRTVHYAARGPQTAPLTFVGVNGLAGSASSFWPLLGGVPPAVRVLLPDMPGCGGSQALDTEHTVQAYADWFDRFCDQLGVGRVVLVSVATGFPISVRYAVQHPDRAAGLISSLPFVGKRSLPLWARPIAAYGLRINPLRDLVEGIRQNDALMHRIILSEPPAAIRVLAERDIRGKQKASLRATGDLLHDLMLMDARDEMRDLHTPMLLLSADHDAFAPLPVLQGIVRGHPERRLFVETGAGHSWNEAFIAKMSAQITEFLDELSAVSHQPSA